MGYLPLDEMGATIFFQLVSARHERGSSPAASPARTARVGGGAIAGIQS